MNIGGIDVRIPTRAGRASIEVAVRTIRQCWTEAVFENGLTGEAYAIFEQIPFGEVEEIFVYQNQAVATIWDEEGAVPRVHNTMIHIIYDPGVLTVVIDNRDAAMNEIIAAISSALSDEIHYVTAELQEAA